MGASKKPRIFSVDGLVASMRPGRIYQIQNLAVAYGVRATDIRVCMRKAVEEGLVDCVRTPRGETYRLVWSEEPATDVAPPAYRNLRLSENLTGYESSLFQHASLCMMVRR